METELAWRDGRFESALELAGRSRELLSPEFDRSLRARLAVICGKCLDKLGRTDEAMPFFDEALEYCPVAFRLLDVPLPVVIVDDGSPIVRRWSERITSSRSFRDRKSTRLNSSHRR